MRRTAVSTTIWAAALFVTIAASRSDGQCCIQPFSGYWPPQDVNDVKIQLNGLPPSLSGIGAAAASRWNSTGCNEFLDFPMFSTNPPTYQVVVNVNWQASIGGLCTGNRCGYFNPNNYSILLCNNTTNQQGQTVDCGADSVYEYYLTHELGHFLGISHTSQSCSTPCLMNRAMAQMNPGPQECGLADDMTSTYYENHPPPDPNCQAYCSQPCTGTHCPVTPIAFDLLGDGFSFTSFQDGVIFDLDADGVAERIGWVAGPAVDDGLLFLDQDGDLVVDNGSELFGNHSQTPDGSTPFTGYGVLSIYDRSEWGGNGDGEISASDEVFGRLRIWIDFDRDASSRPTEIFELANLGITRLGFNYEHRDVVDEYGNLLYYWSWAQRRIPGGRTRFIDTVDVLFSHAD